MAAKRKQQSKNDQEALTLFQDVFQRMNQPHTDRQSRYKKCDEVYNGVLKARDQNWQSRLAPPYALDVVEVLESNIVSDMPKAIIKPMRPQDELGARAMERLIDKQRRESNFAQEQPWFVRQALIRGITVAKIPWVYDRRLCRYRRWENGQEVDPYEEWETFRNSPGFTTVDVNDFWWDPAATRPEDCVCMAYRTWDTPASLKKLDDQGVYHDVDLIEVDDRRAAPAEDVPGPGRDLRGRVEVIELWFRERLIVVANREIVIRDEQNPYRHGKLPFVVASTLPRIFHLEGKSEVELIADLQAMLWDLQNQRIDNTRFITNAMLIVQEGIRTNDWHVEPGKILKVPNPQAVVPWTPDTSIIGPSIQAEQTIRGDMIAITGAHLAGASNQFLDQQTATGVSIVQNMAQRRILRKKQQIQWAYREVGLQWIALNQQLLQAPEYVEKPIGAGGGMEMIAPEQIQGKFIYDVNDVEESLNQEQRRAQAAAYFNTVMSNAPMLMQMGVPVDGVDLMRRLNIAWDFEPDTSMRPQQPQMGMMPPGANPLYQPPGAPAPMPPVPPPGAPPVMNGAPAPAPAPV